MHYIYKRICIFILYSDKIYYPIEMPVITQKIEDIFTYTDNSNNCNSTSLRTNNSLYNALNALISFLSLKRTRMERIESELMVYINMYV